VKALGAHRKGYEVLVRTGARTPSVKLTDVGFGHKQPKRPIARANRPPL
jgi:hypothetical protein